MKNYKTPEEYLSELGSKIKLYRVSMGVTQQELEETSGVSTRSISRLEQGESVQLETLVKVMVALNLGDNIDMLVPDQTKRPSYYLEKKSGNPQRARQSGKKKNTFQWGDGE